MNIYVPDYALGILNSTFSYWHHGRGDMERGKKYLVIYSKSADLVMFGSTDDELSDDEWRDIHNNIEAFGIQGVVTVQHMDEHKTVLNYEYGPPKQMSIQYT